MGKKTMNLIYPQTHAHWACMKNSFQRMSCFFPKVISVCDLRPLPYLPKLVCSAWSLPPGEAQIHGFQKDLALGLIPQVAMAHGVSTCP